MSNPIELKLEWAVKDKFTLRGYLAGHPETTLFLLRHPIRLPPDGSDELVHFSGAFVPDADERMIWPMEQAKVKAGEYMMAWIGMVAGEVARSGVTRPSTDEIPNWRAKNPREGDLFTKHGYYVRVESVSDGEVRYKHANSTDCELKDNSRVLGKWPHVVDRTIDAGVKFIPVEEIEGCTSDFPRPFKSCAIWPAGCCREIGNFSEDMHPTRGNAQAVCSLLQSKGFGGDGKFFPVVTWIEPVLTAENAENAK